MIGSHGAPTRKGSAIVAGARWLLGLVTPWFTFAFAWLSKRILHAVTGRSECERILSKGSHNEAMSKAFAAYLQRSRALAGVRRMLFETNAQVDTEVLCQRIVASKRFRNQAMLRNRILPNLAAVMADLNGNCFIAGLIGTLRTTAVQDVHNPLLAELWQLCLPQSLFEGYQSEGWKRMGFQGIDPKTDFRGNGLLGLENLLYFARHYPQAVNNILRTQDAPTGLPFAILGINITSFVADLVFERQLQESFYTAHLDPNDRAGALELINQIYGRVYALFPNYYAAQRPRDIMSFGPIFARFRDLVRGRIRGGQIPDSIPLNE